MSFGRRLGQTVEKAFIDLGRFEATAGLMFLWLSRAKPWWICLLGLSSSTGFLSNVG